MQTITREYTVYKYDELSQEAKDQALENEISFYIECIDYKEMSELMKKAVDTANRMLTPWFTGNYIYDYCKQEIEDTIRINDYWFTADGVIFS